MINTKAIKNRIKSVKNTKKITKAMEMVSAAKMRRAVDNALGTRSYAELALELLVNISKDRQVIHPLLEQRKGEKILALVVGSNKGLCGGFNANVFKALNQFGKDNNQVDYITIGKKAELAVRKIRAGSLDKSSGELGELGVIASFIEFSDNLKIEEITGLTKIIVDEFTKQKYDKVVMIYTNFVSSINYEIEIRNLLPISKKNIKKMILGLGKDEQIKEEDMRIKDMALYLFEPDEEAILNEVLPRLTEVQIYQALLESIASEHSARMMAMRNASDSADEMIEELTLNFNQARQAGITQEIAEISAGAMALG